MASVYNDVAPLFGWLIGTERRTRVDWKVLPHTEDDVQIADVKTKVLKYVSQVSRHRDAAAWPGQYRGPAATCRNPRKA